MPLTKSFLFGHCIPLHEWRLRHWFKSRKQREVRGAWKVPVTSSEFQPLDVLCKDSPNCARCQQTQHGSKNSCSNRRMTLGFSTWSTTLTSVIPWHMGSGSLSESVLVADGFHPCHFQTQGSHRGARLIDFVHARLDLKARQRRCVQREGLLTRMQKHLTETW